MTDDQTYLLDTSVIIRLFRRRPVAQLVARVVPLVESNMVVTNDVVRTEVIIGCKTEQEIRFMTGAIEALHHLRITERTWMAAARLGFQLRRRGVTAAVTDLLIASSALEIGAVVIHVDGDFDDIAAHSRLKVESYAADLN